MDAEERAELAADHFAALANPLRVRILLGLAATRQPDWDHRGMRYGDLREAVGVEDGGRFNYHLDELRGTFVRAEDGHYWLTPTGVRVVDEVLAGTFGEGHEPLEGSVTSTCGRCDRGLDAVLADGLLAVTCPEHGRVFDMVVGARAAVDRDLDEVLAWAQRRANWYLESVTWNVCPHCSGTLGDATFDSNEAEGPTGFAPPERAIEGDVRVEQSCPRCGVAFGVPLVSYALTTAPAVAFLWDRGVDARTSTVFVDETPWEYDALRRGDRAVARFEAEGARLSVEFDRSLDVVGYDRSDAAGSD